MHIEAYHSKIYNRKEEEKQHIKSSEKIYKNYIGNSKKIHFIKRKETLTYQQHGRLTQNFENLEDKPNQETKQKRKKSEHILD